MALPPRSRSAPRPGSPGSPGRARAQGPTASAAGHVGAALCTAAALLRRQRAVRARRQHRQRRRALLRRCNAPSVTEAAASQPDEVLAAEDPAAVLASEVLATEPAPGMAARRAEELVAEVMAELPPDSRLRAEQSMMQQSFYCDLSILENLGGVPPETRLQAETIVEQMLAAKARRFKEGGVLLGREDLLDKHADDARMTPVERGGSCPEQRHFNVRSTPDRLSMQHACKKDVSELRPCTIVGLSPYEIAFGETLHLKTLTQPLRWHGLVVVVEDDTGMCARLSLLPEGVGSWSLDDMQQFLPKGSALTIKEPYMRVCADGAMGLRVDCVGTNVVFDSGQSNIMPSEANQQTQSNTTQEAKALVADEATVGIVAAMAERGCLEVARRAFTDYVVAARGHLQAAKAVMVATSNAVRGLTGKAEDLALVRSVGMRFEVRLACDQVLSSPQAVARLEESLRAEPLLSTFKISVEHLHVEIQAPTGEVFLIDSQPPASQRSSSEDASLTPADFCHFPSFLGAASQEEAFALTRACFKRDRRLPAAATALKWVFLGLDASLPGFLIDAHVRHLAALLPPSGAADDAGLALFWAALADYEACGAFAAAVPSTCPLRLLADDLRCGGSGSLREAARESLEESVRQMAVHAATLRMPWLQRARVLRTPRGAMSRFASIAVALSTGDAEGARCLLEEAQNVGYAAASGECGATFQAATAQVELQLMRPSK